MDKLKVSISNYRKAGINIAEFYPDIVVIRQSRLINGNILNQKQLVERARKLYPDKKIKPVTYSIVLDNITIEWIKKKMEEHGIKRRDLERQLAIDKSSLSSLLSGRRKLCKAWKCAFFYYFLLKEDYK